MPDLFSIGDGAAVRNLYSNRTIFLVEGPGDKNAFERIVGPGFEADVEFQVAPHANGAGIGGCRAVRDRIEVDRINNPKLYGLMDGEAAAALGALGDLLNAEDLLFVASSPGLSLNGCVFLAAHELENLYFSNLDVCSGLANHAPTAKLHVHTAANIKSTFDEMLGRFVLGAICKYASADFHHNNQTRAVISTKVFGTGDRAAIKAQVKPAITSGNLTTWDAYLRKVFAIAKEMRAIVKNAGWTPQQKSAWLTQLADGKELLAKLRHVHGGMNDAVEGHLLTELAKTTYPAAFREQLFALAGVTPTTVQTTA